MLYALFFFFLMIRRPPRSTPFPTRRSSDLALSPPSRRGASTGRGDSVSRGAWRKASAARQGRDQDRKSTRLNSSHLVISYAVFCLKKKNSNTTSSKTGESVPTRLNSTRSSY